jgi:beta-aspartyl-peptidase (threonine type)
MHVLFSRKPAPGRAAPLLLIHGGAGPRDTELARDEAEGYRRGLRHALEAGVAALDAGRPALDAVCAAVTELENEPLFNAGRGASLTGDGTAEMDAAVMTGEGQAGAVVVSRHVRNPVLAARAVMERTDHVLLLGPTLELAREWELPVESPDYFVTEHRLRQLDRVLGRIETAPRTGTVGAVAVDADGRIACATSTGGMAGQSVGRIGDTGLIGAGTFASADSVAVSCTGEGESYIEGVVAHDIAARIRYASQPLEEAVRATYADALDSRSASGGTIAVTPDGAAVIAHNSPAMFAGYWDGTEMQTFA